MIKTLNSRKVALLFLSILLISPIKIKADTLKFYIDRGVDKVESGDFFVAQSLNNLLKLTWRKVQNN